MAGILSGMSNSKGDSRAMPGLQSPSAVTAVTSSVASTKVEPGESVLESSTESLPSISASMTGKLIESSHFQHGGFVDTQTR